MFSTSLASVSGSLRRRFWEVFWRSFWLFLATHISSGVRNAKSVVRSHIFACVLVDNSASLLLAASCVPQPRVLKSPLQNHCKIHYFLSILLERLSCLSFFFLLSFLYICPNFTWASSFPFWICFWTHFWMLFRLPKWCQVAVKPCSQTYVFWAVRVLGFGHLLEALWGVPWAARWWVRLQKSALFYKFSVLTWAWCFSGVSNGLFWGSSGTFWDGSGAFWDRSAPVS